MRDADLRAGLDRVLLEELLEERGSPRRAGSRARRARRSSSRSGRSRPRRGSARSSSRARRRCTSWTSSPSPRCSEKKCGLPEPGNAESSAIAAGGAVVGVVVVAVLEEDRGRVDATARSRRAPRGSAGPRPRAPRRCSAARRRAIAEDPHAGEAEHAAGGLGLGGAGRRELGSVARRGRSSPGRRSSGRAGGPHGPPRPTSRAPRPPRSRRRRDARRPRGRARCGRASGSARPSRRRRPQPYFAPAAARSSTNRTRVRTGTPVPPSRPQVGRPIGERRPRDVQVHPRACRPTNSARNQRGRDRAAVAVADVLDVGDGRVDQRAVVVVQRQLPDRLADRRARVDQIRGIRSSSLPMAPVMPSPSATTHAPVSVAVSTISCGLLLGQVRERVGEHQPALGVGVQDLGRRAAAMRDHVAGLLAPTRSACSRCTGSPRSR